MKQVYIGVVGIATLLLALAACTSYTHTAQPGTMQSHVTIMPAENISASPSPAIAAPVAYFNPIRAGVAGN